jgi:hypothetical protein
VKWFGGTGKIYAYNDTTWISFDENSTDLLKNIIKINSIAVDYRNKRIIFAIYNKYKVGDTSSLISLISYDGMKWEKLISFYKSTLWNEFIVVDTINPWNILGFGNSNDFDFFIKQDQGYILNRTHLNVDTVILSIAIDPDNRIWMAAQKTIYIWNRTANPIPLEPKITGTIDFITKIVIDQNRIKWFGSDGALVRYDNMNWNSYPFQRLNEFDITTAMIVDERGDVWIGRGDQDKIDGYGLWRFHPPLTVVDENSLPLCVKINSNSPNPFNPSTTISFSLSAPGKTELVVYSVSGQKVRTLVSSYQSSGSHSVLWDGRADTGQPVSSGVYFSRLTSHEQTVTGKMLLLR